MPCVRFLFVIARRSRDGQSSPCLWPWIASLSLAMTSRTDIMRSTNPIERSFELAAERCEDLTPLVYRRLFSAHPEAEAMFRSEGSDPVKGSMLALTIDSILDFAGERRGIFV